MGKRGPAPTPTPVLKLRGSTLVTQERERREVKGPSGTPKCPAWLDADGKAAWKEIVPMLVGMGVLTKIDRNALARYCDTWAQWRKAQDFIREHGWVYPLKDDGGNVKYVQQWPQVSIANKLAQQLSRLEAEFGMTPSARARIQLAPQSEDKPSAKSRYFNAG